MEVVDFLCVFEVVWNFILWINKYIDEIVLWVFVKDEIDCDKLEVVMSYLVVSLCVVVYFI